MENGDVTLFAYNEKDFNLKIYKSKEDSKFDTVLKEKWSKAEKDNVLRYSVKDVQSKVLPGKYGFYLQLNTKRATMRRKPENIMSMSQPFDPHLFNFTKISNREILLDIGDGNGNDIISVNDSPILWSHCLLITQRFSSLPQKVTLYSLKKALDILLLSNSENMRILFNSLCANSSVNHQHWHFYYLNLRMLLESIPLQDFIGSLYILEDYPAKGFCIKLSSFKDNIHDYASYAFKVISCLQENEIAHNIYITRSKTDVHKTEFDDFRIYVWARVSVARARGLDSYGVKNTNGFIIAACELFGHLPIRTEEAFNSITEEYISKCLKDITESPFLSAREKLEAALQESNTEKSDNSDNSTT